jgi:hypothetical protein
MVCARCGQPLAALDGGCRCASAAYIVNAEPVEMRITGQPVGMVVEGPPESPKGRRVDSRPASGGRSYSSTDGTGAFTAELSGPLDRGRLGEGHALEILIQVLRARGDEVTQLSGGRDDDGEDGLLLINGNRVPVQCVSLPVDSSLWRDLSLRDTASTSGLSQDAVQLVRQALIHKKGKSAGTILVLDAAHVGAIVGPSLAESYRAAFGNPEEEFSLIEAWILGPTVRSAIRLGRLSPAV